MPPTCRLATLVFALLVIPLLSGCGESGFATAPVRGKITYKGKPLGTGTILFMPEGDKPSATGEIKPDGTYILTTYRNEDGAVLGPHSILITALEDQTNKLPEERNPTPAVIIPKKYLNFATSGLTADVKDSENTFDFELKD